MSGNTRFLNKIHTSKARDFETMSKLGGIYGATRSGLQCKWGSGEILIVTPPWLTADNGASALTHCQRFESFPRRFRFSYTKGPSTKDSSAQRN